MEKAGSDLKIIQHLLYHKYYGMFQFQARIWKFKENAEIIWLPETPWKGSS